jgi:hypothetical protein
MTQVTELLDWIKAHSFTVDELYVLHSYDLQDKICELFTSNIKTVTIPTDRPLKVGDVLVAIDECVMNVSGVHALTLQNEYPVEILGIDSIEIISNISKTHMFSTQKENPSYWGNYFTLKPREK